MSEAELLSRITASPAVLAGKPVVRGTRLSVEFIVKQLACGAETAEILAEYPGLSIDDIRACLLFAGKSLESTAFAPLVSGSR